MTKVIPLAAEPRARAGKGTARQTRRNGRVLAVIYGAKQAPIMLSLEKFAFNRVLHQPGFFTHLFDVTLEGTTHRVLPRDVQLDPVSDQPLHVDFLRVSADTRIVVKIPVEFTNQDKSPGLKRGGVLNIVLHEIEVNCAADNIPEHITIPCDGFEIGASIHLSSVAMPEGAVAIADGHETVATIMAPSGLKTEAEGEAA